MSSRVAIHFCENESSFKLEEFISIMKSFFEKVTQCKKVRLSLLHLQALEIYTHPFATIKTPESVHLGFQLQPYRAVIIGTKLKIFMCITFAPNRKNKLWKLANTPSNPQYHNRRTNQARHYVIPLLVVRPSSCRPFLIGAVAITTFPHHV